MVQLMIINCFLVFYLIYVLVMEKLS